MDAPIHTHLEYDQPDETLGGRLVCFLRSNRVWRTGRVQPGIVCRRRARLQRTFEEARVGTQKAGDYSAPAPSGNVGAQGASLFVARASRNVVDDAPAPRRKSQGPLGLHAVV